MSLANSEDCKRQMTNWENVKEYVTLSIIDQCTEDPGPKFASASCPLVFTESPVPEDSKICNCIPRYASWTISSKNLAHDLKAMIDQLENVTLKMHRCISACSLWSCASSIIDTIVTSLLARAGVGIGILYHDNVQDIDSINFLLLSLSFGYDRSNEAISMTLKRRMSSRRKYLCWQMQMPASSLWDSLFLSAAIDRLCSTLILKPRCSVIYAQVLLRVPLARI